MNLNNKLFYVCGPSSMVDTMVNILKELNIKQERIRVEHFIGY